MRPSEVPRKLVLTLWGSLLSNPFLMITCFESICLGHIVAVLFRFCVDFDHKVVEL